MKKLSTSVFVVLLVLLCTQFISHSYNRIFSNEESVLEKYKGKKPESSLDSSLSIKELSMIYADSLKRIKLIESGKSGRKSRLYTAQDDPYARKSAVEQLITSKENDSRNIRRMLAFWIAGIILAAAGSLVYIKADIWTGAALVISGFIEMTWSTGPLFFLSSAADSVMMLNVKIILSAVTAAAVTAFWFGFRRYFDRQS